MAWEEETKRRVFAKTDGRCHVCKNAIRYGTYGKPGGWQIDHSVARHNGGTDHLNNLLPAHDICNREKGIVTSRTARGWNGVQRAPLSEESKQLARNRNAKIGMAIGLGIAAFMPPAGLFIPIALGVLGYAVDPES